MGVRTQPKIERNLKIYRLKKEGISTRKLMNTYNLTEGRIYQIIWWVEKRFENNPELLGNLGS